MNTDKDNAPRPESYAYVVCQSPNQLRVLAVGRYTSRVKRMRLPKVPIDDSIHARIKRRLDKEFAR